jgi:hypothetical protein
LKIFSIKFFETKVLNSLIHTIGKSEKSLLNAVKILINSLNGIVFLITIPKTGPLNIMIEDLKLFDFEKYAHPTLLVNTRNFKAVCCKNIFNRTILDNFTGIFCNIIKIADCVNNLKKSLPKNIFLANFIIFQN